MHFVFDEYNLSAVREAENDTKTAGTLAPAASCFRTGKLLNRDYALHAKREVRSTVIGILAGLDLPEGNGDRLPRIHLHGARKLSHFVGAHVGIELGLHIRRDRGRVEGDVVRATANNDELGAIACLYRESRGLEPVAFRVADHLHFVNRSRYWGRCY